MLKTKKELEKSSLLPGDELEEEYSLTDDESTQRGNLIRRLEMARDARNQQYPAFGNSTYQEFYEENRKKAHTILPGKKNEGDVIISTGTLENKVEAVLSSVNNLNLSPEVKAFDKENNRDIVAGLAMEDTISFTEELDEDEEKKIMRQKELLIQGTVFVGIR